jgi:hypothetical protein
MRQAFLLFMATTFMGLPVVAAAKEDKDRCPCGTSYLYSITVGDNKVIYCAVTDPSGCGGGGGLPVGWDWRWVNGVPAAVGPGGPDSVDIVDGDTGVPSIGGGETPASGILPKPLATEPAAAKIDCSKYRGITNDMAAIYNVAGMPRFGANPEAIARLNAMGAEWTIPGANPAPYGYNMNGAPAPPRLAEPWEIISLEPEPAISIPRKYPSAEAALAASRAAQKTRGWAPGAAGFVKPWRPGMPAFVSFFGVGFGRALGFGLGLALGYFQDKVFREMTGVSTMEALERAFVPEECRPCLDCA